MGKAKKHSKIATKARTRESVLRHMYDLLGGINDRVNGLHTWEMKKGDSISAIIISELRMSISERQHRIGILLGVKEQDEPITQMRSALSYFQEG